MTSEKMSDFPLSLFACESDDKYVIHATSALDAEVVSGWSLRGRGALFSHGGKAGRVVIVQHTPRKKICFRLLFTGETATRKLRWVREHACVLWAFQVEKWALQIESATQLAPSNLAMDEKSRWR